MSRYIEKNKHHLSRNYPWARHSGLGKDFRDRVEFMGMEVSRSGLIFDKKGNYKKPTFRYNSKGEVVVRRFRFYREGKQLEFGYDRFVYAAWHQDTFDIKDKDMIVYRNTYTNSGHVDHLATTTRDKHLERAQNKVRYIPLEHHPEIIETWNQVKDVIKEKEMADHLGLPLEAFRRIIERGE